MTGHASREDLRTIAQLEAGADLRTSSADQLLDLAVLYIEPAHREGDAIRVLQAVSSRHPENGKAKVWLAYCAIHYLMDPTALRNAVVLLEDLPSRDPSVAGAALMLQAECLDDLKDLPIDRKLDLLQRSVAAEPGWVFNRAWLAHAYLAAGNRARAVEEMRRAIENASSAHRGWTGSERTFETFITGRNSDPEYLRRELAQMSAAL